MLVKMNTLAAGPTGTLKAGQVYDLPPDEARALLEGGYAAPATRSAPIETATKPAREVAAKPSTKPRPATKPRREA